MNCKIWFGLLWLSSWNLLLQLKRKLKHAISLHFSSELQITTDSKKPGQTESDVGVFNLHLLEFTIVYQFYSRNTILVESTFWKPCHFTIISNYFHIKCYLKWEVSFAPISFESFELITFNHLRYHFICHLICKYR